MTERQLRALKEIMTIKFVVLELNLFLNTHPRNKEAINDYNKYISKLNSLITDYQNKYGLLSVSCTSQIPWQYLETAWPWKINY